MHTPQRNRIDVLADEIAATAATIDAATHTLLKTIREFDELQGWAVQGATSCAAWLSWRVGVGLGTAREQVRVAHRLSELPRMAEALRRGELSYTKVRAMTRVATPDNEELLMHQARGSTGAQLERICAAFARLPDGARPTDPERRYVRKRTHRDGTMTLEMRLLPDEVDELWLALQDTRDHLAPSQNERPSMADAALHWARLESKAVSDGAHHTVPDEVSAETPAANPNPPSGTPTVQQHPSHARSQEDARDDCALPRGPSDTSLDTPEDQVDSARDRAPDVDAPRAIQPLLYVHLRPEHVREGRLPGAPTDDTDGTERWRAELHDGTLISGESLKRIACDCGLVAALVNGSGHPLDLGRRRRTVSVPLMRALQLRDRGCRFPGCKHRAYTQAHHITHWSEGGETNESNLVLLCQQHHVAVHEGGFEVEVRAGENGPMFIFRDAEGRLIQASPERPALHEDGKALLRKRHRARGLVTARPVPLWDGTPLDIDAAVGALAWKRQLIPDSAGAAFPTTDYPPQEIDPGG